MVTRLWRKLFIKTQWMKSSILKKNNLFHWPWSPGSPPRRRRAWPGWRRRCGTAGWTRRTAPWPAARSPPAAAGGRGCLFKRRWNMTFLGVYFKTLWICKFELSVKKSVQYMKYVTIEMDMKKFGMSAMDSFSTWYTWMESNYKR